MTVLPIADRAAVRQATLRLIAGDRRAVVIVLMLHIAAAIATNIKRVMRMVMMVASFVQHRAGANGEIVAGSGRIAKDRRG